MSDTANMPISKGGKFKWLYVILGLVATFIVAAVLIVTFVFNATGPAVDATEDFFARLATDESLEDIYHGTTATLLQEVTPLADFESLINMNPFMEEIMYMAFYSREITTIEGTTYAILIGDLYTEEAYYPVTIELAEEADEWKINLIEFE